CIFSSGNAFCDGFYPLEEEFCGNISTPVTASKGAKFYCDLYCPASYLLTGIHRLIDRPSGRVVFNSGFVPSRCVQRVECITGLQKALCQASGAYQTTGKVLGQMDEAAWERRRPAGPRVDGMGRSRLLPGREGFDQPVHELRTVIERRD